MEDEQRIPFVELGDGTYTRWLPVQQRKDGSAVPVGRQPKVTFNTPLAIGDTERRRNQDVSEIIFPDWSDGMGEDEYTETEGIGSFQYSGCETRFARTLTCRRLATQLGSAVPGLNSNGLRILALNYANARLLVHGLGTKAYRWNGTTWTAIQDAATATDITGVAASLRALLGGYVANAATIYRTTDGTTWDALAMGAITLPVGLAEFDNKLFTVNYDVATATATLYANTNPQAAAAAATWTAGAAFYFASGRELPGKLFVWRYPPDTGKPTLWLLTNKRLLYYDYYATTPTWREWASLAHLQNAGQANLDAAVHPRNGNLYVIPGPRADYLIEYTGTGIDNVGPNQRGGLPLGQRMQACTVQGNGRHLYVWGGIPADDLTSTGLTVAMSEQKVFHHIHRHATKTTLGGGLGTDYTTGEGRVWTALSNGSDAEIWEQAVPDRGILPHHDGGAAYDASACVHYSAWTDMGVPNVNKRVLYAEIDCEKDDGTPGLDAGATLAVALLRPNGSTTTLGTLTDASTFPAVLSYAGGLLGKKFKLRLTLTRGTATTATPRVKAVKLGFIRRPKRRYAYTVRVDLRETAPAFRENGQFNGVSAATLRNWLLSLVDNNNGASDDALVSLAYGGIAPDGTFNSLAPNYTSAAQCELVVVPLEDPEHGDGLYQLTFNDVSAPTSG